MKTRNKLVILDTLCSISGKKKQNSGDCIPTANHRQFWTRWLLLWIVLPSVLLFTGCDGDYSKPAESSPNNTKKSVPAQELALNWREVGRKII